MDAPAIARLSVQLGYPCTEQECRERMAAVLGQPGNAVLVAEAAGQVLGWAHVVGAHRIESAPFAELCGLVVDETHRGSGIGKALVQAAGRWAAEAGFVRLRVRCNAVREESHAFYLRLGFSIIKTQKVFSTPLETA